jgi:nucleotide-binding universal stress UspA family protein
VSAISHARPDDQTAPWSPPRLIGVGVDGNPGERDAVVLGSALARATRAQLILIAAHVEPYLRFAMPMPEEAGWNSLHKQAWTRVARTRDSLAPAARIEVQADVFEWRALDHVVRLTHADLLVVGSARDAREGRVRLGRHAGELQDHLERPLAIAPRGMRDREDARLERIGVGFDGEPESQAALDLAGSIAAAAGAELVVRGVAAEQEQAGLADAALAAARTTGARTQIDVTPGRATDALYQLCERVDLVVIGSSRSGSPGRIVLGRTGHALVRDAPSPMLVAPRPGS